MDRNFLNSLIWVYFSFKGRINRQEYWWANLALMGVSGLFIYLRLIDHMLITEQYQIIIASEGRFEFTAFAIVSVFLSIAIAVKRFHDLGMSTFFALALFVPLVSFAVFFFLGIVKGQPHDN